MERKKKREIQVGAGFLKIKYFLGLEFKGSKVAISLFIYSVNSAISDICLCG